MSSPLYLSDEKIVALAIGPAEVMQCVEAALARSPRGFVSGVKSTIKEEGGNYFQALPSLIAECSVACVKWVSVIADPGAGPCVNATILLTSTRDGSLVAVLDGRWITAVRTAAMSALAARTLASLDSEAVGLIGCGTQAMAHLDALRTVFPYLRSVTAYARSHRSIARLRDHGARLGLAVHAAPNARSAVENQDIVVSSVPAATLGNSALDAGWLKPGAFAALVDLGRSWRRSSLDRIGVVATDDRDQSAVLAREGKLNHPGPYSHDLRELAALRPGALATGSPSIFIFGGIGICDVCVALLCYEKVRGAGGASGCHRTSAP